MNQQIPITRMTFPIVGKILSTERVAALVNETNSILNIVIKTAMWTMKPKKPIRKRV
ncbi:hypothetical protein EVA_13329 [gut metagenome]|uniref:Uncharacterized protein n=1 Tax=gut metagenome TaxID=749906 RepID=J9GGS3_9ZZZZ